MSQQDTSRVGHARKQLDIDRIGKENKEYIRVLPSTEDFDEGSAVTHLRGLLDIKTEIEKGKLDSLPGLGSDGKKVTIDFLALTEGEDRPVEVYYGADGAISAIKDRLEEIYPTSFEIEHVEIDPERKLTQPVRLPVPKFVEHLKAGNLRADYEDITASTGFGGRLLEGNIGADPDAPELNSGDIPSGLPPSTLEQLYGLIPLAETDIPVELREHHRELAYPQIAGRLTEGGESTDNADSDHEDGPPSGATFVEDIVTSITTERGSRGVDEHYVDAVADEHSSEHSGTGSNHPQPNVDAEDGEAPSSSSSVSTVDGVSDRDGSVDNYPVDGDAGDSADSEDMSEDTQHDSMFDHWFSEPEEDGDDDDDNDIAPDGGEPQPVHEPVAEPSNEALKDYDSGEDDDDDDDDEYIPHFGELVNYGPDGLPDRRVGPTIPLENGDVIALFDESELEEHGSESTPRGPVAVGDNEVLARPAADSTAAVATRWRAHAKWRNDWMTTLGSDTRSPGSQANRGTMLSEKSADEDFNLPEAQSKLGTVLNQLTQSDAPLGFQVTIRRKDPWKKKHHRRKVDVEDNTETWVQKAWNMTVRGGASRPESDDELPHNQQRRLQLMRAKTPKQTWNMNIRAVSPLTTKNPAVMDGGSDVAELGDEVEDEVHRQYQEAKTVMSTLQNSLNDLSGDFYHVDSEVLTAKSSFGLHDTNAHTEYQALLDRKVRVGKGEENLLRKLGTGERYYPHFVVNPNELLPLFVIPPEEALASEVYRNTIDRQQSENPLPRPNPELLDNYRDGLPLGYPIDQQGYPEAEPVCLPEQNLTTHIARFATTGSGKSIAVQNDLLHLDENVPGPTVVIDPKGDGLSDEFLQAYYKQHESFESVYHFKAPEMLPALSFFDIRPQLASGRAREDAIQSKVRQFHETMAMVMGREEYESAYAAKDVISFLITALFDKGNNRTRKDDNNNDIPGPYDDAFSLDELYETAQRMAQQRVVPEAPHSDRDIEKILQRQFAKTDQSFQNSMSAVLNRFEKVMQDPQLYRAMNHVAEWDHQKGDYADTANIFDFRSIIEDDDAVVLFDLGAMDEGKHEFASVVLSVLWDAIQKRVMDSSDSYNKTVNVVLEEAAPMVGTKLLSEDLIPQGRAFGVSLELVMQFPEQVRQESERALTELYNDIQTKVFGNIELEAEAAEVLSTDTKPPDQMENKLQQLPPGEWITELPASEFYGQVPTPFSTQALDIPAGHPESDTPLDAGERQKFVNKYRTRWNELLDQHAAEHPDAADTAYYDIEGTRPANNSETSATAQGSPGDTPESSDEHTSAGGAERKRHRQDNTDHAGDNPFSNPHDERDIEPALNGNIDDGDSSDAPEPSNSGPQSGRLESESQKSRDGSQSSGGGSRVKESTTPNSREDTAGGGPTEQAESGQQSPSSPGQPQTDASPTAGDSSVGADEASGSGQDTTKETADGATAAASEENTESGLSSPADLPDSIELTEDGHYQCTICESMYAPSKPHLAAECCQFETAVEGEDVIGYIAAQYGTGEKHALTWDTVHTRLQKQGFDDIDRKSLFVEGFHDHTDENVTLPDRVRYEDPGQYRCAVCRSVHTAGRWRAAVDCCDIDTPEEASHIVQGVFYQHDTATVESIPDDQLAALIRVLATSGVDATLDDLATLSKPTTLADAPWWDTQNGAANAASGNPESTGSQSEASSSEAENTTGPQSADGNVSDHDSQSGSGLNQEQDDAETDAGDTLVPRDEAVGASDSDDSEDPSNSGFSQKQWEQFREQWAERDAVVGLSQPEHKFRRLLAHALADQPHEELADYDLTQSMTELEDLAGDPNIEMLKEQGYVTEVDTYHRRYYDLTDKGWRRTEGVRKPTQPGAGDTGENAAHRIGIVRTANHLRKQDDIEAVETYYQPEDGGPVYDVVGFDETGQIKTVAEVEMNTNDYKSIVSDYQSLTKQTGARKVWVVEDQETAETVIRALLASDKAPEFDHDVDALDSFRRLNEVRDWLFEGDDGRQYYSGITRLKSLYNLDFELEPPEEGGDDE